jgi:hypothetical protein
MNLHKCKNYFPTSSDEKTQISVKVCQKIFPKCVALGGIIRPWGAPDFMNAAAVHVDGPPYEIKRLRTLLNELLGPEHFAYCELPHCAAQYFSTVLTDLSKQILELDACEIA